MDAPPSSFVTTDPATVVRAFFAAMEDGAFKQALALTDERFEWRNTSLPTVRGNAARWVLRGMDREGISFRADFHHVAAEGDVVLTERTDFLRVGPLVIDFWVCGTFRVENGRIVLWDDHFSWGNVLGGVVRGLWRRARGR